jgi:archaellum component FlaG (FlaF/FlaG flagellin family)
LVSINGVKFAASATSGLLMFVAGLLMSGTLFTIKLW